MELIPVVYWVWISLLALDDASELTCDHQTESSAGARRRYPRLLPRGGFLTDVRHSIGYGGASTLPRREIYA